MKVQAEKNKVTILGDGIQTSQFQIKPNPKAFKILSDGLYSNKPGAVIREISCNAYDAHVMAGKGDVPFEVHLPNELEPHLIIKDFGIGLDESQVVNLYTTYFDSTKTSSNEFIGQLGLGSKSPFSYTDSFHIEARYNGVKRVFSAFYNEEGIPTIAKLGEQETQEPNGLTVKVPVRRQDFGVFHKQASIILSRFKTRPKVTGVRNFAFVEKKYDLQGKGWGIDSRRYYDADSCFAIMGNVAYPIDADTLNINDAKVKTILSLPIDIEFEIGSLEVAASREGLSYDKRTILALTKRVQEIFKDFGTIVQHKFNNCKTLWEARLEYTTLFNENYNLRRAFQEALDSGHFEIEWHGKKLGGSNVTLSKKDFPGVTAYVYKEGSRSGSPLLYNTANQYNIPVSKNVVFVLEDLKSGGVTRLRNYIRKNSNEQYKEYIMLRPDSRAEDTFDDAIEVAKKIIKELGDPTFQKISDFPRVVSDKKDPMAGFAWTGFPTLSNSWRKSTSYSNACWDSIDDFDLDDGGFYFKLDKFTVIHPPGSEGNIERLHALAESAELQMPKLNEVVGARKALYEEMEKNPKWIEYYSHLEEKLKLAAATPQLAEKIYYNDMFKNHRNYDDSYINNLFSQNVFPAVCKKIESYNPEHELVTLFKIYEKYSPKNINYGRTSQADALRMLLDQFDIKIVKTPNMFDIIGKCKDLFKKYPMIPLALSGYNRDQKLAEELVKYIRQIDHLHSIKSNLV